MSHTVVDSFRAAVLGGFLVVLTLAALSGVRLRGSFAEKNDSGSTAVPAFPVPEGDTAASKPVFDDPSPEGIDLRLVPGLTQQQFEQIGRAQQQLQQLGASYLRLETWGDVRRQYRFQCEIVDSQRPGSPYRFEIVDADPLAAMYRVIDETVARRRATLATRPETGQPY